MPIRHLLRLSLLLSLLAGCGGGGGGEEPVGPTPPPGPVQENPGKNHIGMNLYFPHSWGGTRAFVDLMKQSASRWYPPNATWGHLNGVAVAPVAADANGWPLADASVKIWDGEPGGAAVNNGTYTLVFTGKATNFGIFGPYIKSVWSTPSYDAASNTSRAEVSITIDAGGSNGFAGGLVFTGTQRTADSPMGSGITNVHLYRPGYQTDGSEVFTKEFLRELQGFPVIRYLDWDFANVSPLMRWSDRTLPESTSQLRTIPDPAKLFPDPQGNSDSAAGVAFEHMIQLSNTTGADMWVHIPVNADDDFVRQLARLIRDGRTAADGTVYPALDSRRKVYLEYGNELWNFAYGFKGYYWLSTLVASAQADAAHPIVFDGNKDQYTGRYRYVGWRLVAISNIFREEFGDNQMQTRIRPVLEGQISIRWVQDGLQFIDAYYGSERLGEQGHPVNYYLYGAGSAAYYAASLPTTDAQYFVDHYFDADAHPDLQWRKWMKADVALVRDYGLKRVAYEGGPGMDVRNSQGQEILSSAQKWQLTLDPRMENMIQQSHDSWSQNGGDLLVYYSMGASAEWGFLSSQFNADGSRQSSPKMTGLKAILNANRAQATIGLQAPGTLVVREFGQTPEEDYRLIRTDGGFGNTIDNLPVWVSRTHLGLPVSTPKAGKFRLIVNGGRDGDPANATDVAKGLTQVWVNGQAQTTVSLQPANKAPHMADSEAATIELPAGFSMIRLVNKNGFYTYSIRVTEVP